MEASILQSVDISVARLGSLIGVSAKVGVTLYEHRGEGKDVVHHKTLRVLDQM